MYSQNVNWVKKKILLFIPKEQTIYNISSETKQRKNLIEIIMRCSWDFQRYAIFSLLKIYFIIIIL